MCFVEKVPSVADKESDSESIYSEESDNESIDSERTKWNEVRNTKFLQLLEANIAKPMFDGREIVYWEQFAEELNKRIKVDEPQFVGFEPTEVLKRGKELRSLYHKFKNIPYALANFATYDKCFKKCDTCTDKPLKCDTCHNTPSFSFSSFNDSRKRRATTSAYDVFACIADFVNQELLSFKTMDRACSYFQEFPAAGHTWLKMSFDTQLSYLQQKFPE